MPTPLDRVFNQRATFFGFAGIVTAVAAWTIWGPDTYTTSEPDPTGDPETWTRSQLLTWLNNRRLIPSGTASREELLREVQKRIKKAER